MKQLRFRPRPLATLTAMVFTAAFAALGVWQLQRAEEKRDQATAFEAQRALPAVDLADAGIDIDADRYRDAGASGEYLSGDQILVDNVVFDGRPGYEVFAPLRLSGDKGLILVDRGWVSQGATRQSLPQVETPGGKIEINGWLDHPRSKPVIVAGAIDADQQLWPYLDMEALSERIGSPLPNYVLHAAADSDMLHTKAPEFESKVGMHIGYAIQWFAFAAAAAGTYIALNLKKSA